MSQTTVSRAARPAQWPDSGRRRCWVQLWRYPRLQHLTEKKLYPEQIFAGPRAAPGVAQASLCTATILLFAVAPPQCPERWLRAAAWTSPLASPRTPATRCQCSRTHTLCRAVRGCLDPQEHLAADLAPGQTGASGFGLQQRDPKQQTCLWSLETVMVVGGGTRTLQSPARTHSRAHRWRGGHLADLRGNTGGPRQMVPMLLRGNPLLMCSAPPTSLTQNFPPQG